MIDHFTAWAEFQKEMLDYHRAQLDAAKKALDAGTDMVAAQKAITEAGRANLRVWDQWLGLWGMRK